MNKFAQKKYKTNIAIYFLKKINIKLFINFLFVY